jgi:aryl-alcohol dehydrogenase-like predicted oxidoreductase
VAYENDPENHFAAGGVTEALLKAKEQGKVRYIGFTGHKHPRLHKRMLSHGFPFDSVQMPLNPFDASFRSFEEEILPIAKEQGMAVIGMKSLGGSADMVKKGTLTAQEALSYAMSLPVTTTVSGMPSLAVLYQNLAVAGGFEPWPEQKRKELAQRVAPLAADGRFEMYKVSARFEGKEGRIQHGFPLTGA